MANSGQMLSRSGWSEAEKERLFDLARGAEKTRRPLKSVFEEMARLTGRRPNSVRNYYYARVREAGGEAYAHQRAFKPFTDEETAMLVETVLGAQAAGESVRSCTLRMAGGDDKAMLRYQNKYRSVLKTNPELVRRVMRDLTACGHKSFDPYMELPGGVRAGRPRKTDTDADRMAAKVVSELARVPGLNVNALMEALGTLAVHAAKSTERAEPQDGAGAALRAENAALKNQLNTQHQRYRTLLGYFTQLMRINSEFLSLNSVVKVSNLSTYIRDLESNVKNCQQLMLESAR